MLQSGLMIIPMIFIQLSYSLPLIPFRNKKFELPHGKNEPFSRFDLIEIKILTMTDEIKAPSENSKAAAIPRLLINPRKKLFVPRNTPAIKLGKIRNLLF